MFTWIAKGGVTAYPLIVCSFISLGIVIERLLFWLRHQSSTHLMLRNKVVHYISEGHLEEALSLGEDSADYLVQIYVSALKMREFSIKGALEMTMEKKIKKMRRFLFILDTIITLSPLLGILGTILGIISSFDIMGQSGLQDTQLVTGGIAEALISTALGLTIAIFTLIPFNWFQSMLETHLGEMDASVMHFELLCSKTL